MGCQRPLGCEGHAVLAEDFDSSSVAEDTYLEDFSRGGREANSSFRNLTGGHGEEDGGWAWIWEQETRR